MTADRPRLAAAAEAAVSALFRLHRNDDHPEAARLAQMTPDIQGKEREWAGWGKLPAIDCVAAALAPHVPERDELVAGLREIGRQWRSGAALAERLSADDPGVIACGAQLSECAEQVAALLARLAPEPNDG